MTILRTGLRPILPGLPIALSAIVLGVCLFFTFSSVTRAPYPGIQFDTSWNVEAVLPCEPSSSTACLANEGLLVPGDQLQKIGTLTLDEFQRDRRQVAFAGYDDNSLVPITLRRDGVEQTISWQMVGPTSAEQVDRVRAVLIYLPFWLAGTAALFLLRPRNERWRVLLWFNFILAVWLAAGTVSHLHIASSSLVQRALAWFLIPICLNLHLMVPSTIGERYRRRGLIGLYALVLGLAGLELFQRLPGDLYLIGLLVGIGSSLALLFYRFFDQSRLPDRSALRLMLGGIGFAFVPALVVGLAPMVLGISTAYYNALNLAVFAIPILPFFYLYAIYKRNLGELEFRANQLLSSYSFALFYLTALGIVLSVLVDRLELTPSGFVSVFAASAVFVLLAPFSKERFQGWFNRLAYGMRYQPDQIIRALATDIPGLLDGADLAKMVRDEIAPSLMIRESALYVLNEESAQLFYAEGQTLAPTLQAGSELDQLRALTGHYRSPHRKSTSRWHWVRFALELRVRENTVGYWLMGRRDPDDFYPFADRMLLEMVGNQMAVALENIRLFANETAIAEENARLFAAAQEEIAERKRVEEALKYYSKRLELLSQELVEAQETERKRVASDLHDSVVQWLTSSLFRVEVARQLMTKDPSQTGEELNEIEAGIKHSIHELRSTIVRLHPPELEIQGLAAALQQYVKTWRTQTKINATLQVQGETSPLPLAVETGLYRMCQEALNNVAKHAHATVTNVDLAYTPDAVSLRVQDNGVGFDSNSNGQEQKGSDEGKVPQSHFGLLGMSGRAKNIGGELSIESRKNIGTTILVTVPVENKIGEPIYG